MPRFLEYFRNASQPRQFAAVAGLALAVLLVLGAVWFFLIRTAYRPVFTDLQPADAAIITAQLEKDRIAYRLGDGGSSILVPEDQVDAARVKIMGSDLPLRGTVGLELFGKSDMGMTDFAQKINYQRALQGELARTIMSIDGVETARVHLALGENRVFRDDRVPPKASIVVKMRDGGAIPASTATGIQRLVAAAIDQLEPGNVVVLDEQGRIASTAPADDDASRSPAVAAKQAVEAWFGARVRQAIEPLMDASEIEVSVRAGMLPRADGAAPADRLPDWDIAARNFSLEVTLSPRAGLSPRSLDQLRALAGEAIGFDAAKGDTIAFGVWNPRYHAASGALEAAAAAAEPSSRASRAKATGGDGGAAVPASRVVALWLLVAGAALALAGALLVRRRRGAAPMGEAERLDFADRLNRLLHEEGEQMRHAGNR